MGEYIEREHLMQGRVENDPVRIAAMCAPATDVAPVRHGRWILKHIGAGHMWECSCCHKQPCIYITDQTKFCPNCGAKMDLVQSETGET